MKSTTFKETNLLLGAGNNPNTNDLPVAVSVHNDFKNDKGQRIPFTISKFKLSPEELEYVNKHGHIYMSVMAYPPAPIMPMACNPFEDLGFQAIPADQLGTTFK